MHVICLNKIHKYLTLSLVARSPITNESPRPLADHLKAEALSLYLLVVRNLATPTSTQVVDSQTEIRRRKLEYDLFGFDEQTAAKSLLQLDHVLHSCQCHNRTHFAMSQPN